jgi:hypothetical protein
MRGQPTKAKAKVIKEKREMAAELGTSSPPETHDPKLKALIRLAGDVLEFEAKRGLGITRRGPVDAPDAGQQEPQSGRGSKRAAARRTVVASATYVGSSEDQNSSGSDTRSESEDEESDGSGGGSEPESEDEDTGRKAREKKRKTVRYSGEKLVRC